KRKRRDCRLPSAASVLKAWRGLIQLTDFMAQTVYHASIEGAQHGAKSLTDFLDYAKRSGASGAQPSNYMLHAGEHLQSAKQIRDAFESRGMTLDGISAHCPFWVHTSAWTGTKSGNPFIAPDVAKTSPTE